MKPDELDQMNPGKFSRKPFSLDKITWVFVLLGDLLLNPYQESSGHQDFKTRTNKNKNKARLLWVVVSIIFFSPLFGEDSRFDYPQANIQEQSLDLCSQ